MHETKVIEPDYREGDYQGELPLIIIRRSGVYVTEAKLRSNFSLRLCRPGALKGRQAKPLGGSAGGSSSPPCETSHAFTREPHSSLKNPGFSTGGKLRKLAHCVHEFSDWQEFIFLPGAAPRIFDSSRGSPPFRADRESQRDSRLVNASVHSRKMHF